MDLVAYLVTDSGLEVLGGTENMSLTNYGALALVAV